MRLTLLPPTLPVAVPAAEFQPPAERVEDIRSSSAGGQADLASRRPVTPRTRSRIGSITKGMTGMALLMAAAARELDLDALDRDKPVAELVAQPPVTNLWSARRPIAIAYLLKYTAAFQDRVQDHRDLNEPLPVALPLFRRPADTTATGGSARDADGRPCLEGPVGNVERSERD
jgi:CubicO group peptidase (beta-lactamase class C family)